VPFAPESSPGALKSGKSSSSWGFSAQAFLEVG
jgi:hypothetical protein